MRKQFKGRAIASLRQRDADLFARTVFPVVRLQPLTETASFHAYDRVGLGIVPRPAIEGRYADDALLQRRPIRSKPGFHNVTKEARQLCRPNKLFACEDSPKRCRDLLRRWFGSGLRLLCAGDYSSFATHQFVISL